MRRKLCCGLLLVFSIIFGLSSVVSSDVSAINYVSTLRYVDYHASGGFNCETGRSDTQTAINSCRIAGRTAVESVDGLNAYLYSLETVNSFDVSTDYIYEIRMFIHMNNVTKYPLPNIFSLPDSDSTIRFKIVDFDIEEYVEDGESAMGTYNGEPYGSTLYPRQNFMVSFFIKPVSSGNTKIKIGKFSPGAPLIQFPPDAQTSSIPSISIAPQSAVYYYKPDSAAEELEKQNEQDAQDRSDLSDQSSDIDSDAASSSSDAESTGSTLLSAFSAFVSAMTSASPSNCNIDMDLGNLDLGVVNLCSLSPPQPIPTIASILMIMFFVPLSISTARKVISLFRSFQ